MKKMMTFNEAKAFVKTLNLKNEWEFHRWYNANRKMAEEMGLPEHPDITYQIQEEKELQERIDNYLNNNTNENEKNNS